MNGFSVLEMFHPIIKEWFEKNIGKPSSPQIEGWPAIRRRENVLILAPTGAGKTLSAFLECINCLFEQGISGELEEGVQVLYVSPLKALNNDIYRNLEVPLREIEELCHDRGIKFPGITMGIRTGDTPQKERRSMIKNPPHILITTPESLYLLLTSSSTRNTLRSVRYLIIDEIHTLLGNKRGVHLSISIERLAAVAARNFSRIGLSATVKPASEAAKYLGGYQMQDGRWVCRDVTIVQPILHKAVDLKIAMPVKDFVVLEEKTIWPSIYREILSLVSRHNSTLVFVNSRAAAERVAANLNDLSGKTIAMAHHGCISREARLEVESELKSGKLPCLVATSSMELGIDVGAIDLMIQVASPKSVARGVQRLGRAGHRLDSVSIGRIIPRTRADLLESVIVSKEMLSGNIEEENVPKNCLDVLAQQLVSMACTKEWAFDEILELIKHTCSYHDINPGELERVLLMLSGEYEHHQDSPRSPRLVWDRVNRVMRGNSCSRMLAVSGSTIPDRGYYGVYMEDGKTRLGELDETFVYEARIGERFMLGTSSWRIQEIRRDRVVVSPSTPSGAKTPFWTGEGLGRPYQLGIRFGAFLDELSSKAGKDKFLSWITSCAPVGETAARNLEKYVLDQIKCTGCLAGAKRIVIEHFSDEVGDSRMVIHSPFGGRVNAGLKIVLQHVLSDALHCQVETSHSDDGVLINILGYHEHPKNIFSLLAPERVFDILVDTLPTTPLFSITFRHNAARALMMGQRRYGKRMQLWAQRIRAIEVMQVAEKYTDHPLIVETFRECMDTVLDIPNLVRLLKEIHSGNMEVVERITSHPSPFTSELLFGFTGVMMYEGQVPDPKKINDRLISRSEYQGFEPVQDQDNRLVDFDSIHNASLRSNPMENGRTINSMDEFHDFLLTYGDIILSEENILFLRGVCKNDPEDWIKALSRERRGIILEQADGYPKLFIASEEHPMYRALGIFQSSGEDSDGWTEGEALSRIVRRFARYNSPFSVDEVAQRYGVSYEKAERVIKHFEEDGLLLQVYFQSSGHLWCHKTIYERARRIRLNNARKSVDIRKSSVFASFLPGWQGVGKTAVDPVESLYEAIKKLQGMYLPAEWWEDFIFPSRIPGYRKSYLDKLCSTGRAVWRINNDGTSPRLAWYATECINMVERIDVPEMDDDEREVYGILKRKGASFFHAVAACAEGGNPVINTLEKLVWKGVVSNDSFEPIRYFMASKPASVKMRAKTRAAAYKIDMGRWDIVHDTEDQSIETCLMLWLNRYGLVSREVLQCEKSSHPWSEAYEILKQWEYTGRVNRGYYIEGLSGMQFILPEVYNMLYSSDGYIVLDACDPAQAYGRIIHHDDNMHSWTCVPGTAVVQKSGVPVLIVECWGERFLPVSESKDEVLGAVKAFCDTFRASGIWPSQRRLKMKQWGESTAARCEFSGELDAFGFDREMQDLVLWK